MLQVKKSSFRTKFLYLIEINITAPTHVHVIKLPQSFVHSNCVSSGPFELANNLKLIHKSKGKSIGNLRNVWTLICTLPLPVNRYTPCNCWKNLPCNLYLFSVQKPYLFSFFCWLNWNSEIFFCHTSRIKHR